MARSRAHEVPIAILTFVAAGAVVLQIVALRTVVAVYPFTEFGSLLFDAGTGSVFALCAIVAGRLRAWGAAWLMMAGSITWTFGTFWPGLQPDTGWWSPLFALSGATNVVVLLLIVTFPTGRIEDPLSAIAAALSLVFMVIRTAVRLFAVQGDWCLCVPNPFQMLPNDVGNAWFDLDGRLAVALSVIALAALIGRWVRRSRPWRATNLLMTATAAGLAVSTLLAEVPNLLTGRDIGPGLQYLSDALAAAVPIVYVAGLIARRQARGRIADVVLSARSGVTTRMWDELVAQALDDRSARVLWLGDDGSYRDSDGEPAAPRSSVQPLDGDPAPALIEHDPAVASQTELLASLAASISIVIDNDRLQHDLSASLTDVRESRTRLVAASDDARRRIERDLHDGAQQFLLAAALTVERARSTAAHAASPDPELHDVLEVAVDQLRLARTELRELARGILPAALDQGSFVDALEELALRSIPAADLRVDGDGPVDDSAARTAYFVIAEGLTNAAKHGRARSVEVRVRVTDRLVVSVTDDGAGRARIRPGGGLEGLRDRVTALGGTLTVAERTGGGTTLVADLPAMRTEAVR